MNNTYDIIVLFGRPGAGKDTVAEVLRKYFDFGIYNADRLNSKAFMNIIDGGGNPTSKDRDAQCRLHIKQVRKDKDLFEGIILIVNWTFLYESQREMWRKAFPNTLFVYIDTPVATTEKRLKKHPRSGHNVTTKQAIAIAKTFEEPIRKPDVTIVNTGTRAQLESQVVRIF